MILSMTGFGSSRVESSTMAVSVEARTVNHRYLDLHIRLPPEYQKLEPVVRKAVSPGLGRGRVDVFVKIERTRADVKVFSDPELIAAYVELFKDLKARFPISGDLTVESLSRLPGAIQVASSERGEAEDKELRAAVEEAVRKAVDQVRQMRIEEGLALVADLRPRLDAIRKNLGTIEGSAAALVQHYRTLITNRVAELAPNLPIDSSRLEVEALIHAEKADIAEEITRLASHLDQFGAVLDKGAEAGKRLDFLLQEMNREVSTMLSKTSGLNQSGASIGEAGIDIKVEIDKLREQVQNIE